MSIIFRNGGGLNGSNILVADSTVHNDQAAQDVDLRRRRSELAAGVTPTELKDVTSQDIVDVAIHSIPVLTGADAVTFNIGRGAVLVDPGIKVTSLTNKTLASATVQITQNFNPGFRTIWAFSPSAATGNIVGSFDSTTGTLTLTSAGAAATVAQFQTALSDVAYFNAVANPTTGTRNVTYRVFDGALFSNALTSSVDMNFPPVVSGGSVMNYTTLQALTTVINPNITVSDADNNVLTSATVAITTYFQPNQDILSFTGNASTGGDRRKLQSVDRRPSP